jgi:hypothetical protein
MGLATLLLFPIPTLLVFNYYEKLPLLTLFEFKSFFSGYTLMGFEFGVIYAFLAILLMRASVFDTLSDRIEPIVRAMKLNLFEIIFLSFCAGFGEEILFRVGVQHYLGIWLTSILFIAIHGYFHPLNWRKSLYGLILLPFILIIAYAYQPFGLWFCIAAHFSYDLVLFLSMSGEKED